MRAPTPPPSPSSLELYQRCGAASRYGDVCMPIPGTTRYWCRLLRCAWPGLSAGHDPHAPARTPRTPALMPTRSASVNPIGLIGREEAVPLKLLHLGGQELEVLLMEASLHRLNLRRGNRSAHSQGRL